MREELSKINEVRATFTGTFVRLGMKTSFGYSKPTLLLREIKGRDGNIVADHLWFNLTRAFAALNLKAGDVVRFDARVRRYEKGYKGYRDDVYKPIETDYKLDRPTRVVKI